MLKFTKTKAALVGAAALALVAGSGATAAFAATPAGSSAPWYVLDGNTGAPVAPGTALEWNDGVIASPDKDNVDAEFVGSADATDVVYFLSKVGEEKTPSTWVATGFSAFKPGTKNVLQPTSTPGNLTNGNPAGAKAQGGDYSLGIAFTKNNRLTIADAGVIYTIIHVTPVTGKYTFDSPTAGPVDPPVDPPVGAQTGEIALEANTIGAADGALSLVVPAGAKAVIGSPTLVDNLSTSTGTLGQVTVKDARVVSHPGWDLTSTVADFVNGATTIDKKQLGFAPKKVSGPASAGAAIVAGDSIWPTKFASADNSATVGDTVLDADLKFIAPATAPAGTYTSKMTLTLVSK